MEGCETTNFVYGALLSLLALYGKDSNAGNDSNAVMLIRIPMLVRIVMQKCW